ncbi:hypothetical protein [Paraburkholderia gardini]|uniref:hypothetical protein n=1 Tax=Paraburkholderia gardini TaxID=2823469 RepID=UPI001E3BBDC9|nr:hypothetical protein [Paraburkholderia gardini]
MPRTSWYACFGASCERQGVGQHKLDRQTPQWLAFAHDLCHGCGIDIRVHDDPECRSGYAGE